jgi:hypothetical protein
VSQGKKKINKNKILKNKQTRDQDQSDIQETKVIARKKQNDLRTVGFS